MATNPEEADADQQRRELEEIRRNAERGFRAVTLPERPHEIGVR